MEPKLIDEIIKLPIYVTAIISLIGVAITAILSFVINIIMLRSKRRSENNARRYTHLNSLYNKLDCSRKRLATESEKINTILSKKKNIENMHYVNNVAKNIFYEISPLILSNENKQKINELKEAYKKVDSLMSSFQIATYIAGKEATQLDYEKIDEVPLLETKNRHKLNKILESEISYILSEIQKTTV